jgi:hypothetical protein
MDLWNDICFIIDECRNKNYTEREFQIKIESIFEKLGYSKRNGEIESQRKIPVGAAQRIEPDIIVKCGNADLFVNELKKPSVNISSHNKGQLVSYMRQLKLKYGILWGETLQLYYDHSDDNESPKKIFEINFTSDNKTGVEFIDLLKKANYSDDLLSAFCQNKLNEMVSSKTANELVDTLVSHGGEEIVLSFLRDFLKTDYTDNIIQLALDSICVNISKRTSNESAHNGDQYNPLMPRHNPPVTDTLPVELIPPGSKECERQLLRTHKACFYIHYADGRIESEKWSADKFSETSNLINNIRSKQKFRSGKWQELGIVKVICEVLSE